MLFRSHQAESAQAQSTSAINVGMSSVASSNLADSTSNFYDKEYVSGGKVQQTGGFSVSDGSSTTKLTSASKLDTSKTSAGSQTQSLENQKKTIALTDASESDHQIIVFLRFKYDGL